ncbi:hypothetical protein GCM10010462_23300 [Microbacterium dextranolyticum]|uniref:N-acetyltransferase domain-containing protein n=1 Tax=Microbacterium dextranolyticum TaxID=36806 RepID=A0A9W6HK30_9MICO|nr:hypothetical protein GCM10017591_07180 [Microbacterium dextranolyticum]
MQIASVTVSGSVDGVGSSMCPTLRETPSTTDERWPGKIRSPRERRASASRTTASGRPSRPALYEKLGYRRTERIENGDGTAQIFLRKPLSAPPLSVTRDG